MQEAAEAAEAQLNVVQNSLFKGNERMDQVSPSPPYLTTPRDSAARASTSWR